ncbi:MAG: hypothetical protein Q8922_00270 [Bacteroidota bacterium]|nr:hypothetical protein [Bacteroidota bacterium]MDP4232468.1 hypothetical protein [Bacteroidota bacterium]MDP4241604.1 hypothetical protein [Bacteroidota bacterium]MDP4286348.1 hypothetical protein [Bacteroidota bacterium]
MQSRPLLIAISIVLLLLGLVGLVLPGLQGIALLLAGLLMLGQAVPAIRRATERWEAHSPLIAKLAARFRKPDGKVAIARLLLSIVLASALWTLILYTLQRVLFHD